ncbi:hypothetical protein [Clostridium manihotivorum]|uniref:DUF6199 domain-containing protein n=1 Tax=Clostridium manihotivorum TaxID=2320868 RepID=A0A410DT17_9CLOT|nr:hypothetical protein [Clostridium manihotivorum]QAA32190.1 hypothetical protein C1I91_11360 [Clostridium manihotivorum]
MKIIDIFFILVFSIPIIVVLLYMIFYPRERALFGRRWQFKNENLEPSDEMVKYNRNMGIIVLVFVVIIIALSILKVLW